MQDDTENMKFGLKPSTISLIRGVFLRHPNVEKVIVYGSRARGNFKNGSDIDLTIKGGSVTLSELFQIENELDDLLLPYKIDLSLMHKLGNPLLLEHIARVGVVFYPASDRTDIPD